ncbi:hypothetical protein [Umezawaea tangerina]|uniref:BNR/Asp-box repeat protein n=1 Tax=Umezawaea tangerina TaxID=84725 RepID=A0A2T0T9J8_9PSEU|nr:hypothetical protein [Umezawaea tangerina]PRY42315.1 hypothetical protein CLV43_104145 [Umezawaea tangerina]
MGLDLAAANGRQIVADPEDADLVYVAVAPQGGDRGSVLRSRDAGRTFRAVLETAAGFTSVVVSGRGEAVFAGGDDGVQVSTDHGARWKVIEGAPKGVRQLGLDGRDLFVGTGSGVHLIENAVGKPGAAKKLPVDVAVDSLSVGGKVVVAAGIFSGAFLSTDHGRTWRKPSGTWGAQDAVPFVGVAPSGDVQVQTIEGSPDGTGRKALWVSRDLGRTWAEKPATEKVDVYTEVGAFPDRPDVQVVAASAGIFTTRNSVDFERIGIPDTAVNALTVSGSALIAGTPTGSYRSTAPLRRTLRAGYQDWGWTGKVPDTIGNTIGSLEAVPGKGNGVLRTRNAYCPGDCFVVERSADGGSTWQHAADFPGNSRSLVVDPRNPANVYTGAYLAPAVYVSTDGGVSFTPRHDDVLTGVNDVAVDPTRPTGSLWIADVRGLYLSTAADLPIGKAFDGRVEAVAVDPADPKHVVAVGDGLLKISYDAGKSFADGVGAPGLYYTSVTFGRHGELFAGTRDWTVAAQGVQRSTDGGKHWKALPTQPADREVRTVLVSPDGTWLFAGTMASGVHRLALR